MTADTETDPEAEPSAGSADTGPERTGGAAGTADAAGTEAVPTEVPADERPAATCRYCGRPFRTERRYWLHVGEAHPDDLNEAERSAHERAVDEEGDDLFIYHMKVVAWLVVLLFFYIYTYALVWSPVY